MLQYKQQPVFAWGQGRIQFPVRGIFPPIQQQAASHAARNTHPPLCEEDYEDMNVAMALEEKEATKHAWLMIGSNIAKITNETGRAEYPLFCRVGISLDTSQLQHPHLSLRGIAIDFLYHVYDRDGDGATYIDIKLNLDQVRALDHYRKYIQLLGQLHVELYSDACDQSYCDTFDMVKCDLGEFHMDIRTLQNSLPNLYEVYHQHKVNSANNNNTNTSSVYGVVRGLTADLVLKMDKLCTSTIFDVTGETIYRFCHTLVSCDIHNK